MRWDSGLEICPMTYRQ